MGTIARLNLALATIATSATTATLAQGQPVPAALARQIDSAFAACDRPGSPGCALGLSHEGARLYARGYGLADLESGKPITPATVFNIGSTSKQFVAFAIHLLAARGRLSLDDDVRKLVPELADFGERVTIRHLLHHTSGLRDYASLLSLMGWLQGDQYDQRRFLSLMAAQRELNFPPGARYLYSNTGYVLLATIVSRASGTPWRDFAATEIFGPLGMSGTEIRGDPFAVAPGRALAYEPKPGGGYRLDLPNHDITGSTAVMTSVEDLARWERNFSRPAVGDGALLRRLHARGVLHSGDSIAYASGLQIRAYRGLPLVEHAGGTGGYRGQLWRFPEQRVGIAVLCNAGDANPDALARRVADLYLKDAFPAAVTATDGLMTAPVQAASYAGSYLDSSSDDLLRLVAAGEGDTLFWRIGGTRVALRPGGRDRFEGPGGAGSLRFERDAQGAVTGMLRGPAGEPPVRYQRVTAPVLAPNELDRYAGSFYSLELDRTWWVRPREGRLRLVRRDFAESALEPAFPDGFSGPGFTLRFVREASGAVGGLLVSNGRALHLRFERVAR